MNWINIKDLPVSAEEIKIGKWEKVTASPYGKSIFMYNQARIESVKQTYSRILQWNIPACVVKINTTASKKYNVAYNNSSKVVNTKKEAIDLARNIIGAILAGFNIDFYNAS